MPSKKVDSLENENKTVLIPTDTKKGRAAPRTRTEAPSFFEVDFNLFKELEKSFSPDQLKEWTSIYASYRSKTPLSGTVIGVDTHRLAVTDPVSKKSEQKQILCLVVMNYRVKVIVPQTEVWFEAGSDQPEYLIKKMVGARIDYIITNVDIREECAIASRQMAAGYLRYHFFRDKQRSEVGKIVKCNVLVVGPTRIIAECNGFDLGFRNKDLSYTAIADLRNEYRPGQELTGKLIKSDQAAGQIEVSIKEVNPNPFYGADKRHPLGSTRQAIISGTYAGGVFCRLTDDTTCLCFYSPSYFDNEFYIGDSVMIGITRFDYDKKMVYGRILQKM